jgi:hypothetical protein
MSLEAYRIFGPLFYVELAGSYDLKFNRDPDRLLKYNLVNESLEPLPLYEFVCVPKYIMYLTLLPIVSRLAEIKQLAYTYYLIPGGAHTRYEHSMGVMLRCERLLDKLSKIVNEKCKDSTIKIGDDEKVVLQIAALLHDIGHSSWGHALDGITGHVVHLLRETLDNYLFSPRKLDTAIALYLLRGNEQLTKALQVCSKEIKDDVLSKHLNKVIAQIIMEEEPPFFLELEGDKNTMRKVHLLTTILGSYRGRGGVNADRLDWFIRDAHHTNLKVKLDSQTAEKFNEFLHSNIKNDFAVDIENCEFAYISDNAFNDLMQDLREKVYTAIYEGVERALIDSWLTRLAYTAIDIIYRIGDQISSLSTTTRAIMGFLLMHDYLMKEYTDKILTLAKHNINLLGMSEPGTAFIQNSTDLLYIFDHTKYIMHSLSPANFKIKYSPKMNLNFEYLDLELIRKVMVVITAENMGALIERAYNTCKKIDVAKLAMIFQNFLVAPRLDPIAAYQIPLMESLIRSKFEDANIHLLINYYLFRKLDDRFMEEIHDLTSLKEVLTRPDKLGRTPFIFILADKTGDEKVIEIFESTCAAILTHLINCFAFYQ